MSSVLEGFRVLEVPRTFSIAEVRVLKNKLSFNMTTASELGYPGYVRLFFSDDGLQLAIQPCRKEIENAREFFTPDVSSQKKKAIPLGNRELVKLIKQSMGWDMEARIYVPGIRFSEEKVLVFDLHQGYKKGTKSPAERGICVRPKLGEKFYPIPTEYLVPNPNIKLLGDGSSDFSSDFGAPISGRIIDVAYEG